MQSTLARIRSLMTSVDPYWAMQNPGLNFQLSSFSHDGIIAVIAPSGRMETFSAQEALDFAKSLDAEASTLVALAARIAAVTNPPSPPKR